MERQDSATSLNMNPVKFNMSAPSFTPSKKDQRLVSTSSVIINASPSGPDQRTNELLNKRNKPKFAKQARQKESGGHNKRSARTGNNNNNNNKLSDPFEEEILNGKIRPNSRRGQISINHLLDFSLPDNHHQDNYSQPPPRRHNRRRRSSNNVYGPKIHLTGERYINVNYKFVVDHRGDYRPQILDTNLPIERNNILRVIIPKNDTQCPICLTEDLVAPRMASCGHTFCLTCLLRYLDSEDPVPPKKNDPVKTAPKLKECPLCSKKIKQHETLPVLINPIDERFETPKIGEDAILQLMYRPHNKILAFPYQLKLRDFEIYNGNIPWFSSSDSHKYNPNDLNITGNDLFQYSRLMKAGVNFTVDNYLREIQEIKAQYEEDKVLFNDDGIYYNKAVKEIESMIHVAEVGSLDDQLSQVSLHNSSQVGSDLPLEELSQRQMSQREFDDSNTFFFYQTSFNSKIKFFVSALDNKILKALYGNYSNFPLCLKMKIENIVHDYVVNDELVKRFKFLSYIPHGTEVAFLELNWFEDAALPFTKGKKYNNTPKRKSILPPDIYHLFQKELVSRSDKIRMKNFKEEKSRLRYQDELEFKTREFYANENNFKLEDYGVSSSYNKFDPLIMSDDDETDGILPPLSAPAQEEGDDGSHYQTTVWGTKIVKPESDHEDEDEDGDDYFNELLRISKEKEEKKKMGKKGKKKLVLMSTAMQ